MGIVDRDEETLEIVAASAVPAGAEVHNTYVHRLLAEGLPGKRFAKECQQMSAAG